MKNGVVSTMDIATFNIDDQDALHAAPMQKYLKKELNKLGSDLAISASMLWEMLWR